MPGGRQPEQGELEHLLSPLPVRGEVWAGPPLVFLDAGIPGSAIRSKEGERHLWQKKSESGVMVSQRAGWKPGGEENTNFSLR